MRTVLSRLKACFSSNTHQSIKFAIMTERRAEISPDKDRFKR